MPIEVILPRVDMDMTAGRITKWHVEDGERIRKGAVVFEIETDKAAMEVESPGDGVIQRMAPAGEAAIPVGSVVAFIYGEGEAPTAPAIPVSKAPLHAKGGAIALQKVPAAQAPAPVSVSHGVRATPLARRLARENGLVLDQITGSGPRGRIVAADIRPPVQLSKPHTPLRPRDDGVLGLYEPGSFELVPHDGMRRTIARRLVEAKHAIPHFYLTITCDLDNLLSVRKRLNAHAPRDTSAKPVWKISVNDLLIKALGLALQRVPEANASWSENAILRHQESDIGVAVAVDGGLFMPVIRRVETKSLSEISNEMKDLAHRARAKRLPPSEYQGGTTAISNLGMFGIEQFSAIINPPQASILAVGAVAARPAIVDGAVAIRTHMTCTLSCDHRVIDGALGAQLLGAFRELVEAPELMLA
jgi:pyruvate dehydrogenase E2 component (dihydrolipoyllysine-residue acetyltransferase)